MRSRFAAFALGGHGQYLLDTWYTLNRPQSSSADLNYSELDWSHLCILEVTSEGDVGDEFEIVEFIAWYNSGSEKGLLHERSRFCRQDGRWVYIDGDLYDTPLPRRNDTCLCNSGKKYKKCCALN